MNNFRQIDLKKTIDNAKYLRQVDVARDLDMHSQYINNHYKTNVMSNPQNIAYILYFEKNGFEVFYV